MAGTSSEQQKDRGTMRAAQACNPCRQRKGRCDGKRPCHSCQQHISYCVYESRQRRRGPGRSKEYIRLLEAQLRNVTGAKHGVSPLEQTSETCTRSSGHISTNDVHLASAAAENASAGEPASSGSVPARSILSKIRHREEGNADGKRRPEYRPSNPDTDSSRSIEAVVTHLQPTGPQSSDRTREPCSLVPTQGIVGFLESTIDSLNTGYPFLSTSLLLHQLSTLDPTTNLAWRALIDTVMLIGMLFRSSNSELTASIEAAQVNCKNAHAQILQIVDLEPAILAIEALLSIGLFRKLTSDTRTAAQIVSQVIRIFQMISLQSDASCLIASELMDERHRRALRTAYILDMEMIQCGLPPTIDDEEFGIVIQQPETRRSMQGLSKTSQVRAEVAAMEKIIYKRLYRKKAFEQPDNERMLNISEIDWGLSYWRLSIEPDLRLDIDNPPTHENLDFEAARRHGLSTNSVISAPPQPAENFRVVSAIEKSKRAARAILGILPTSNRLQFIDLWDILCYPISAMITLLVATLEDPLSSSVRLDLGAMGSFCHFLETMVAEEYDLRSALQACIQMKKLSQNAVNEAQAVLEAERQGTAAEDSASGLYDEVMSSQAQMSHITDTEVPCLKYIRWLRAR
ncbi:hypothetical protein GGR58DRAFT_467794 [Xylaria digitata]|nr:hypothetical protein GGR58DRAFT_467794 [Xylaria digitata]